MRRTNVRPNDVDGGSSLSSDENSSELPVHFASGQCVVTSISPVAWGYKVGLHSFSGFLIIQSQILHNSMRLAMCIPWSGHVVYNVKDNSFVRHYHMGQIKIKLMNIHKITHSRVYSIRAENCVLSSSTTCYLTHEHAVRYLALSSIAFNY